MTIDLTGVAVSIVGAVGSIITAVFLAWLQGHMKDKDAAATISNAVQNSIGAAQQAVIAGLQSHPLQAKLPAGTPPATAAAVQYVLDNAGPELKRFTDITPETIASKVGAKIGLTKVAPAQTLVVSSGPSPIPPQDAPQAAPAAA